MKVKLYESIYNYESDDCTREYITDWFEVTEEEYKLLSKQFKLVVSLEKECLLEKARKAQEKREKEIKAYKEKERKRKEKLEATKLERKQKQLDKIKKEVEELLDETSK